MGLQNAQQFYNSPNKGLLAEFGNFHYGLTGAANGLSLTTLLAGAGGAQVFLQKHDFGNLVATATVTSGVLFFDPAAMAGDGFGRWAAEHGLRWGDNGDDTQPIIEGNDLYESAYHGQH